MARWEYKSTCDHPGCIVEVINPMGEAGWELVSTCLDTKKEIVWCFLKRKLDKEPTTC